jgi:hypothetical protein
MDEKPFLVLDLMDIDETLIPELRKLTKEVFDLDSIINSAEELKYIGQIKRTIAAQFTEPVTTGFVTSRREFTKGPLLRRSVSSSHPW